MSELELFARARACGDAVAIVDEAGSHSYRDLLAAASRAAGALLAGRPSLAGERVAFLVPPSFDYVATLWGIWLAGGVAVPLALSHPPPELEHAVDACAASLAVATPELAPRLAELTAARRARLLATPALWTAPAAPAVPLAPAQGALILYTSGTTGRPKGAVLTHGNVAAQTASLIAAWGWRRDDRILEVLPLHHTHGIINVVTCALAAGAVCEVLPRFDAEAVWERFLAGGITLFMAVPTIYVRLIAAWEEAPAARRQALSAAAQRLRLMVSGSAALPVTVLERWREITGHTLLERYGMTEIGMALSNPLAGERVPGAVGTPLPGVEVRLVDEAGDAVADGASGELEVRGKAVFREYFGRPDATREAFRDGWFRTGDVAVRDAGGVYRLLGRRSVDIIKSGGEKISALEIEGVLLRHPAVRECAVVGLPDAEWGEQVAAAIVLESSVLADGAELDLEGLRAWARDHLAVYKLPRALHVLDELPRNAMGKVVKPALVELLQPGNLSPAKR